MSEYINIDDDLLNWPRFVLPIAVILFPELI